ncbi:MAG TPA: hypothetical protein VGC89_13170 [Pyrinomonadaceae bacterium]|jgi:hypothetical protein
MKDSQARELDASQRMRAFVGSRPSDFPSGSHRAELSEALNRAITQVEQQAAKQVAATLDRQESAEEKKVAINSLVKQLRAISQTARSLNQQFPGLADQFKMPRDSNQSALNYGRAYIEVATPIASRFTKRDLPDTFLTDLQSTIDSVVASDTRMANALANQTAATAALTEAFKQLRAIQSELDASVRNFYRNDPASLAAWNSARRVERAPKKASKKSGSPP